MKLDKDSSPTNMNMVKLDEKIVLVRPSQAESTKGKEIVIGEERHPRMISLKNLEIGQWKKNERSKPRQKKLANGWSASNLKIRRSKVFWGLENGGKALKDQDRRNSN
jgi:hypothetical protein